jgi:hypothetical protein
VCHRQIDDNNVPNRCGANHGSPGCRTDNQGPGRSGYYPGTDDADTDDHRPDADTDDAGTDDGSPDVDTDDHRSNLDANPGTNHTTACHVRRDLHQ